MPRITALILLILLASAAAHPQERPQTIDARTRSLQKLDGYLPLYWDKDNGKLFMEITRFDQEFLYQLSLPAGVASNTIGPPSKTLSGFSIGQMKRGEKQRRYQRRRAIQLGAAAGRDPET